MLFYINTSSTNPKELSFHSSIVYMTLSCNITPSIRLSHLTLTFTLTLSKIHVQIEERCFVGLTLRFKKVVSFVSLSN